jgi:hypothetical protein
VPDIFIAAQIRCDQTNAFILQNVGVEFVTIARAAAAGTPVVAENQIAIVWIRRIKIFVLTRIKLQCQSELFQVAETVDLAAFLFRPRQTWQQQRRQRGDNSNHYQQFEQREACCKPWAR